MTVTDKFKDDSQRAAIRALRSLEDTAIMLERWAPDIFPEVNEQGQKHFGRCVMESAAEAIRQSWANAIKDAEASGKADQTAAYDAMHAALRDLIREIRAYQSPECDDEDAIGAPELKAADAAISLAEAATPSLKEQTP